METKSSEIQVTKTVVSYIAIDGTEFENREECEKYESSALCVASRRLLEITVSEKGEYNQESLFLEGDCEHDCQIVKPRNSEDIDAINKVIAITNRLKSGDTKGLIGDNCIGQLVIINFSYENDWVWIHTENEIREHWDRVFSL